MIAKDLITGPLTILSSRSYSSQTVCRLDRGLKDELEQCCKAYHHPTRMCRVQTPENVSIICLRVKTKGATDIIKDGVMANNLVDNVSQVEHQSVASTTSTASVSFRPGKHWKHYHNLSKNAGRYLNASIQITMSNRYCHCHARSCSTSWTGQAPPTQQMACHRHQSIAHLSRPDCNHRPCLPQSRVLPAWSRYQHETRNGTRNAEEETRSQSKRMMLTLCHSRSIDKLPTSELHQSRLPSWLCSESNPASETHSLHLLIA